MTSCDSTLVYSFLTQANAYFLKMCLVSSTIANMCTIMIHLNALDINECHSEEIVSFDVQYIY